MKLSIITVNLNKADGLKQTLESVANQTFRDIEFIVIDGGSTDGSLAVIDSYADTITRWVSEPDTGIYNAMNKGLSLAHGEYVQFLNSGDRLVSPDILHRIFEAGDYREDLLYGNSLRPDSAGGFKELTQPGELTLACFFKMGICHQTIFYKRELFETLGSYDESLRIAADWDFNLKVLLARRSTRHLPFPVCLYEGKGISSVQTELSALEKKMVMTRRLPDAVYRDYLRLQELEKECARLKQYEDWALQIRTRNPLMNLAMVARWAWLKLSHRRNDPS